jgi:hypothetical protein
MRISLMATVLAAGIALPAAAQNTPSTGPNGQNSSGQASNLNAGGQTANGCGKQAAWTDQMSDKLAQSGYTSARQVPQALVLHAIGPDGIPVVMLIVPALSQ